MALERTRPKMRPRQVSLRKRSPRRMVRGQVAQERRSFAATYARTTAFHESVAPLRPRSMGRSPGAGAAGITWLAVSQSSSVLAVALAVFVVSNRPTAPTKPFLSELPAQAGYEGRCVRRSDSGLLGERRLRRLNGSGYAPIQARMAPTTAETPGRAATMRTMATSRPRARRRKAAAAPDGGPK